MFRRLKQNSVIRGLYTLWKSNFYNYKPRMGYYSDNVIITPPHYSQSPKRIFIPKLQFSKQHMDFSS